jgi:hypothetical protein
MESVLMTESMVMMMGHSEFQKADKIVEYKSRMTVHIVSIYKSSLLSLMTNLH